MDAYLVELVYDALWWLKRNRETKAALVADEMVDHLYEASENRGGDPDFFTAEIFDAKHEKELAAYLDAAGVALTSLRNLALLSLAGELRKIDEQSEVMQRNLTKLQGNLEQWLATAPRLRLLKLGGLPLHPGRPTGPRTIEGKRAASQNAPKHGLSRTLESSGWGEFLDLLADHLQETEKLPRYAALDLAGQILEFERNLAFQREALRGLRPFQKAATRFDEGSAAKAARMGRALETGNFEGVSKQELREAARFFRKLGRAGLRGKLKREAEGFALNLHNLRRHRTAS